MSQFCENYDNQYVIYIRAELKPNHKKTMLFLNQKICKTFNGKIK